MYEYRHLNCSRCGRKLRIRITEKDFGKTYLAKCPECGPINRVTIPTPPEPRNNSPSQHKDEKSFEELLESFNNIFTPKQK